MLAAAKRMLAVAQKAYDACKASKAEAECKALKDTLDVARREVEALSSTAGAEEGGPTAADATDAGMVAGIMVLIIVLVGIPLVVFFLYSQPSGQHFWSYKFLSLLAMGFWGSGMGRCHTYKAVSCFLFRA